MSDRHLRQRFSRTFLGVALMGVLMWMSAPSARADGECLSGADSIAAIRRIVGDDWEESVSRALGRRPESAQVESIAKAARIGSPTGYSAGEFREQGRILKAAGLDEDSVRRLRLNGLLGNWTLEFKRKIPLGTHVLRENFYPLDQRMLRRIQDKEPFSYVVDEHGRFLLTPGKFREDSEHLLILDQTLSAATAKGVSSGERALIREGGEMRYDSKAKGFRLEPKYLLDWSAPETEELLTQLHTVAPNLKRVPLTLPGIEESRVLKCTASLSDQKRGKNHVLSQVALSTGLTIGGLASSELMGAGRLNTDAGRRLIIADLTGSVTGALIGNFVGLHLAEKSVNRGIAIAVRGGVAVMTNEIQRQLYGWAQPTTPPNVEKGSSEAAEQVTDQASDQANDEATALTRFNYKFSAGRIVISDFRDRALLQQIPDAFFRACLKDSKLKLLISPGMVRIYDSVGSTMIYYGLRSQIEQEIAKPEAEE